MTNWQSITIGLAFGVFIVWMERKGRWALFAGAAAGDYQLANTRGTASTGSTPSKSKPSTTSTGTTSTTTTTTTTTAPPTTIPGQQ